MKYYVGNNFAASELHEAGMVNLGVSLLLLEEMRFSRKAEMQQ